jgi:hypothetical protein
MENFEPTFELDFFKKIRTPYKPKPLDLIKLKNKWKGTGYCFLGNLMIKKQDWELAKDGLLSEPSKIDKNIVNWYCVRNNKIVPIYSEFLHPRTRVTIALTVNEYGFMQ